MQLSKEQLEEKRYKVADAILELNRKDYAHINTVIKSLGIKLDSDWEAVLQQLGIMTDMYRITDDYVEQGFFENHLYRQQGVYYNIYCTYKGIKLLEEVFKK